MYIINRVSWNYTIVLLACLVIACSVTTVGAATYVDEVLNSGPILYWRLDDQTAGVGGAADSTGNGNVGNHIFPNGTVGVEGFPLLDVPGNLAAEFVAEDVILSGGPAIDIPETGAFSIELFFKPSSMNATSAQELAAKGPNPNMQTWYLLYFGPNGFGIPEGTLRWGVNGQGLGPQAMDAANTLSADSWVHLAATYDTNPDSLDANLYVNGQLSATQKFDPAGPLSPNEPFIVGGLAQNGITNTANGTIDEVAYYDKALTAEEVKAHFEAAVGPPTPGDLLLWNRGGGGGWFVGANWRQGEPGDVFMPNSQNAIATFGDMIEADSTVFFDQDLTVNTIRFDNANSYVIAGSKAVNLSTGSELGNPTIDVVQGTHQFQANVALHNNTTVTIGSGATLEFNNRLNLNGSSLTKTGSGTMAINNNVLTNGGTVNCQEGTCSGTGTVSGNLNNDSTVAPGNSPGILTVDGDYTQGANATLAVEIGGLSPGEDHDKLVVTGVANLDGTLDVSLIDGFGPNDGDAFDILDSASVSGNFNTLTLPANFNWDVATGVLTFGSGGFTDFDNDGTWNLGDLNLVLFNWQKPTASLPGAWVNQKPAVVGLDSLNNVLFNWQQSATSLATVPEPVTAVLLLMGLMFLMPNRQYH